MPADSRYFPVLAIPGGTANQVLTAVGDNTGFWADPTVGTGPVGPAGPTGPVGPAGATGTPGSQLLTGAGAPSSGVGNVGDFYVDTLTNDAYMKTGATTWAYQTTFGDPERGNAEQYGCLLTAGCGTTPLKETLTAGSVMVNSSIRFAFFRAPKSFTSTKVTIYVGGVYSGSTPTISQIALYSLTNQNALPFTINQIAIIANDPTLAQLPGSKNRNWVTPIALTKGTWYAAAILIVQTGGALPTFMSTPSSGVANNPFVVNTGLPYLAATYGATATLPASLASGFLVGTDLRTYFELT